MKTGKTLRDEGTVAVLDNESNAWKAEAHSIFEKLISAGNTFTSEDLRNEMTLMPHHPNAWGGFLIAAVKKYDLEVVGLGKSSRPVARAHVMPIWAVKKGNK
jgi:hypothetical protein